MPTKLEEFLNEYDEAAWLDAIGELEPSIHPVDRTAVQIWFRFYPLSLFRAVEAAEDREAAIREFALQGRPFLKDQIDTSHHFLYGHRYWPQVKAAIESEIDSFEGGGGKLAAEIVRIAGVAAGTAKANQALVSAITAAGLMTLVQSGAEAFKASAGQVKKPTGLMAGSPDKIVREREKDDSQGMLGFLKTINKKFSVIYDESSPSGRFPIMNDQQLTSASAEDRSQNWQEKDPRCWAGVIPIECTAASCGTCWVGVLGGEDKLTEVAPRERRRMKVFGYEQPADEKPFLRLACQARALGNVTIVIPPWNGVFGKEVYGNVEELELEPVTTSAKQLRETVRQAIEAAPEE